MLPFDRLGEFWLPDTPDTRVPGRLTFVTDVVELTLFGAQRARVMPEDEWLEQIPERVNERVMHGRFFDGGEIVSVLNVAGVIIPAPEDAGGEQNFLASAVLLGGHASGDGFVRALIGFDALEAWAHPEQIVLEDRARSRQEIVVRMSEQVLGEATCADQQVRLITRVIGTSGPSVHLDQRVLLEVTGDPVNIDELITSWVRPLQNLLIICLGRPVAITEIWCENADADRGQLLSMAIHLVQPDADEEVSASTVRSYDRPTLLLPDNAFVPFHNLVPRWCDLIEEIPDVLTQLCSPFYAPFMYSEHRYASTFQAAEAFARKRYSSSEKSKAEHAARVKAITDAAESAEVDLATAKWAGNVLQGRNDKSLPDLISELLVDAGAAGEQALAARPDLAQLMTKARTGVSHGGAKGTTTVTRYWLGELLVWILRLHLIRELGVPDEEAQRLVRSNPGYTYAIEQLSNSVT